MAVESPSRGIKVAIEEVIDPGALAVLAHDVRNPLGIVVANLDLVLADPGCPRGELGAALRDARAAADRIGAVLARLEGSPDGDGDAAPISIVDERRDPAHTRPGRILLVDDEQALAVALRRNLRGHDVVIALAAEEALERLAGGETFDVILCDLMMPGMTGCDLHEELERIAPEQARRMIFMTGGATTPATRDFAQRMPSRILQKPCNMQALRDLIAFRLRT